MSAKKPKPSAHAEAAMAVGRRPSQRPGPPGGKRDLNRRRRVSAISRAALELFLARGVDAVTIDDIAHEAGIAKGSFYRYFRDKTQLVELIVEPVAERAREALDECHRALESAKDRRSLYAAYEGLGRDLMPLAIGYLDVMRLYLQESRAPGDGAREPIRALALEIERRSVELTEVAVSHGLLRVSDPRISALAVVGAIEQLALSMLGGRLDAPPIEIAQTLIGLVLDGVRAR